jgi:hypothetical protein
MDYQRKYLKYKSKYQNLVGGMDPPVQEAIRLSLLEQEARTVQTRDIDLEFFERLQYSKILVIGASFDNENDLNRWGEIDPNFIGVSHMSKDPIGRLGSWKDDPKTYWRQVFSILDEKKFDAVYLDQGTFQHLITETLQYYTYNIDFEPFKFLVENLYSRNITDKFYLEFDLLNLHQRLEKKVEYFSLLETGRKIKDFSNLYYSYEYEFKSIISFFYKYFKCCGDIQEIVSNEVTIRDGGQVLDKWIAYIRR